MKRGTMRSLFLVAIGAGFGTMLHALWRSEEPLARAQPVQAITLESLASDIEAIKGKLPDQAHAMQDVGYHAANLWFAGQQEHWDLANFYWTEVRSHLRWAARIIPLRKDNAGRDVDVQELLKGFENGPLADLQKTIVAGDRTGFEKEYRDVLDGCYGCHKAADKPFIRPQIPMQPETPMINFDPAADWPR
jgi:hypothetical protein